MRALPWRWLLPALTVAATPSRASSSPARPAQPGQALPRPASAAPHRRHAPRDRPFVLTLPRGFGGDGLRLVPPEEERPYTLLESSARQIALSMVLFDADLTTVHPILKAGPLPAPRDRMNLVPPQVTDDVIQQEREYAQIMLASRPTSGAALAGAITIFTGMSMLSARPPRALRFLFDRPLHIGPATFEYGGLGLGLRGRWNVDGR